MLGDTNSMTEIVLYKHVRRNVLLERGAVFMRRFQQLRSLKKLNYVLFIHRVSFRVGYFEETRSEGRYIIHRKQHSSCCLYPDLFLANVFCYLPKTEFEHSFQIFFLGYFGDFVTGRSVTKYQQRMQDILWKVPNILLPDVLYVVMQQMKITNDVVSRQLHSKSKAKIFYLPSHRL